MLTFTPAQALRHATTYSVEVNGATDVDGQEVAPRLWQFTTEADVTAPTVAHVSPAGGATGVSVKTKVVVRFSEAVSDAQITAADAAGAPVLGDIAVDAANTTWTLTFGGPLNPETAHTVSVSGGRDPAGNVMEPYSWSFTTAQPDTVAPTVTASSPEPNAVDVALGGPIKATLSEPVSEGQIVVKDPAGGIVAGTLAADSTTVLSFTPAQPLAERTKYTVEVTGAKDDAGNVMALHTWSFTTKELPPPPNSPMVLSEYVTPTSDEEGTVTSTLTPRFIGWLSDPDGRSSTMTVEVEHDPTASGQGSGLIWSGSTTTAVSNGSSAGITIASGKLTDGWKVRWRARATAAGVNGAWTTWHTLNVDISKPTVSSEYVTPTSDEEGTVTSTLTPRFIGWLSDPDGRSSTMTVEVEHDPTASGQGSGLIWSGSTTTAVSNGSSAGITIASGKLTDGWKVRWRARATAAGVNGAWTTWHTLNVSTSTPALPTGKTAPAGVTAATDTNTSGPFDYQRMSPADCNAERLKSPRPWHGFGWTVMRPYTGCYSRIAGWGDWEVDLLTGLPKTPCPKSQGVRMTVNVIMYTNLGTTKDGPVVYGQNNPNLKARDISIWINISELIVVGANCVQTNVLDGRNITVRVEAAGSDNSDCDMIEGPEDGKRIATIGEFKRNGQTAFVFRSQGSNWGNCTLRPKLYPGVSIDFLDPEPFKLWHHLGTEQIPTRPKGDFPFVARCDSIRLSYPARRSNGDFYWPGHTGGCRILGADRVYTMYTEDPFRGEVARHIRDAFQNPQATDPKLDRQGQPITKKFPGNYDVIPRAPLTRWANSELAPDGVLLNGKNRTQMTWYCPNLSGNGPGKECDEYPFRSTFQALGVEGKMVNNVWTPTFNASLRMVSAAHNEAAGFDLGAFYSRYRVFTSSSREGGAGNWPSNAFWVRIRAGAPPS